MESINARDVELSIDNEISLVPAEPSRSRVSRRRRASWDRDSGLLSVRLSAKSTKRLRELSRGHDTTLFERLQSAWALVLRRWGGQDEILSDAAEHTQLDISLSLSLANDEVAASFEYSPTLFERGAIERMVVCWQVLLERMTADPDRRLNEFSMLTAAERDQVLHAFNNTDAPYARDRLIHELFEDQVRRTPELVAVCCGSQQLTYAELNRRANGLARALLLEGVRPDDRVAVYAERSIELVIGLLGALKAGAAYVPLDPSYPGERVTHMIRDSEPRVVLTQKKLRTRLPAGARCVLALDANIDATLLTDENPDPQRLGLRPQNLAYLIYTSGSTGTPKGVMVEHHNAQSLIAWNCRAFDLREGVRSSCVAAVGFDATVWEIWPPLSVGATLVMAPASLSGDAEAFLTWWGNEPLDLCFLPTPMAELAFRRGVRNTRLRTLLVGGDRLRHHISSPSFTLVNNYGPTETTVVATSGTIEADDRVLHIGRPIANTRIYILDAHRQPVPVGVTGEIYIGGAGVARGYLNRPELTAERFVSDPFIGRAGARMYRTGDLARWLPDGAIEFLGRNDDQVKIRGFRIELGEIEARLERHPLVKEALVIAREEGAGEKRLVAYITTRDEGAPSLEDLRAHVKAMLPEYMVPSAFVPLESLPLTPNGKIDRRALPGPELAAYVSRQYEHPANEAERVLACIWQDVLRVERVGRRDSFFELGGHSLLIVEMMERLRLAGLHIEVRAVYERPTLTDMAGALTTRALDHSDVPPNRIPRDCSAITPEMVPLVELKPEHIREIVQSVPGGAPNVQDIYPLAPLQEGILFHHKLDERGDTYVLPVLLSVSSRERLEALVRALQQVIDRHDILRTAVLWEHLPQPVQVVYRSAPLPVAALTLDPSLDAVEQLKEQMKPEHQRLDLRRAPLMRLQTAADTQSDRWYALLQLHHMIADHESVETMLAEVKAFIDEASAGLPEPIPYRNHVALTLARAKTHDSEAFFRVKLGDVEEPTAPFGLLDVHGDGSRIERTCQVFDAALAKRIRDQARTAGVSAATLFHAAWALVVAHAAGRDDVVFGTVLLGRLQTRSAGERGLGLFINTLPLRLRLNDITVKDLVEHTRRELVELLNYEHASLSLAQRCSGVAGSIPLFSTLMNYLHSTVDIETGQPTVASGIQVQASQEWTSYPIALSVYDQDEGFGLMVKTDRRISSQRVADYVITAVQSLVDALEQAPQISALTLSVLPESERRLLIESFNATQAAYPHEKLIHELFEEQARRTPHERAVAYEGQSLTYAELNRKANQLARHLRDKGVGPDRLVGLCIERGVNLVLGLLGILKSGGAYVPLDPDYPPERLSYILANAAPAVLVTQERLLDQLPDVNMKRVVLDRDWGEIAISAADDLDSKTLGLHSDHLAYVIYTSGSTGQPKGVMVEHRNVVSLWQSLLPVYRQSAECQNVAINAPFNFDASVKQWVQLLSGRTLFPVPQECRWDATQLLKFLNESRIHGIDCTPSQLKSWIAEGLLEAQRHSLRLVLVGGEPIDSELWRTLAGSSAIDFYNVYGPTECTVDATVARLTKDATAPHIGRPMENKRLYILDDRDQVAPLGAAGQICIGGTGVARGYLNHPELTRERFVPNPFDEAHERLYRTGDMGRWREDGCIEYLGRNDHQVKIRGYRIELGEIEAQLLQHPRVKDSVVLAREDERGDKRLVAYVAVDTPQKGLTQPGQAEEATAQMVAQWNKVHDETYSTGSAGPSFVGWNSSYTGQPIPEAQMQEWLDSTLARIRTLQPRKVLEIGCGVGLLLQHLAPQCAVYVGTDFSAPALSQLKQWMGGRKDLTHVELLHRAATELQDLQSGSFDTVILNSVVQYFPDIDYLAAVLQQAVRLVGAGGNIFIGDVRHLGLLPMFHSAVQLGKAAATINVGQLRRRIARALAQEKELVIDPQFFHALAGNVPGISGVEVKLKEGAAQNELTRYRYDVVLRTGEHASGPIPGETLEWNADVRSVEEIERALSSRRSPALRLRSIPNARLARDATAQMLIETSDGRLEASALRRKVSELPIEAVDPQSCWQLGRACGYEAEVTCDLRSKQLGSCEALFWDPTQVDRASHVVSQPTSAAKGWSAYANDPLDAGFRQQLFPELREHLKVRLPEYMVPVSWVVLKQLPITPNGKVDRRALPAPQSRGEELGEYVAPRTEVESIIAETWAEVLQIDQVGLHDNFFETGGHSLLAMQVIARIRASLLIDLPMSALFKCPTVETLAARIDELRRASASEDAGETRDDIDELLETVSAMPESEVKELMQRLEMRESV